MPTSGLRSSGGVFHDTVKAMVVRSAEGFGYYCELEDKTYSAQAINQYRPDVLLTLHKLDEKRKHKVFVEIQESITNDWIQKIMKNYEGKDLIIISLDKMDGDGWSDQANTSAIVEDLYHMVEQQIDMETLAPEKERRTETKPMQTCPDCGARTRNVKACIYKDRMKRERKRGLHA